MNRIIFLLLVCFPMLALAGPICGNCTVHHVLPAVAAGDQGNGSQFHPNDLESSFFNPAPPDPQSGAGKLLVFMPGAGTNTKNYTHFLEVAANHGYHAVVVSDWNEVGMRVLCHPHADCYGPLRKEIFDGTQDPTWNVNGRMNVLCAQPPPKPAACGQAPAYFSDRDTVQRRLLQLIHHLHHLNTPDTENWGQFLVDPNCKPGECKPEWGKVVLAGHSMGAGEAAFIATQRDVARIIMISGVDDDPATWTQPARTHPEKYFGLAHLCDTGFYASSVKNWNNFNLPGTLTFIESGLPPTVPTQAQDKCAPAPPGTTSTKPYGQSHRLVSGFDNGCSSGHNQVAVNCAQEPDVLLGAWRYMLTAPVSP